MPKKNLSTLLEPSFRLYFLFLALFALATAAIGEYVLAVAEAIVVLFLLLYFRQRNATRRRDILNYIENVSANIDVAAKDTMVNAPLPMVIFRPDTEEVIWSNDHFLQITGERDHLFDRRISDAVPGFDPRWLMEGKSLCPLEVELRGRRFQVYGHMVRTEGKGRRGFLATTYWLDVTESSLLRDEHTATRPVIMLLVLDNYEDIFKGVNDNVKSAMLSDINRRLDEWCESFHGLLCRLERDRRLLILEERYLPAILEKKFDLLDQVREVVNPSGMPRSEERRVGKEC